MTSPASGADDGWHAARGLLTHVDETLRRSYEERGLVGVRARYAGALLALHQHGPMTIRALASQLGQTHSALSQTVSAMRRDDLVISGPGTDARTRLVRLTEAGRTVAPGVADAQRAMTAVLAELDAELPRGLAVVVGDATAALERRSLAQRLAEHLHATGSVTGSAP